mgnify:CR=1 FL=1
MRHCWRWFDYSALCEVCGWKSFAKNALGNAAKHFNRTGHKVSVEVSGHITYMGDADNAEIEASKKPAQ